MRCWSSARRSAFLAAAIVLSVGAVVAARVKITVDRDKTFDFRTRHEGGWGRHARRCMVEPI